MKGVLNVFVIPQRTNMLFKRFVFNIVSFEGLKKLLCFWLEAQLTKKPMQFIT